MRLLHVVARLGAGVAGMGSQEECVCSCIVLASWLSLYLGPCATRLVTQFRFTTALGLRQLVLRQIFEELSRLAEGQYKAMSRDRD
jgi:hypothetical protein